VLVVADDLTGAADAAGAFATAGHRVIVHLDYAEPEPGQVTVIDTDSRTMAEADAFLATAAAVELAGEGRVFIKIDSTLRGHVRAAVDGALSALTARPSRVVVCPAFPARGRTVDAGAVYVDGEMMDGPTLRDIFSGFTSSGLFIPAARTDDEISGIVKSMPDDALWVGSAGLARHVAERFAPADGEARTAPVVDRGPFAKIAVVAGSQHERTAEQLEQLSPNTKVYRVDPRDRAFVDQVVPALRKCDGLVLTGGHTARVVLDALGIDRFVVRGEVEVGIPHAEAVLDGRTLAIITKAGAFGDAQTLRRAVRFLV
jgi:D-threonate/D-erythronate kinase